MKKFLKIFGCLFFAAMVLSFVPSISAQAYWCSECKEGIDDKDDLCNECYKCKDCVTLCENGDFCEDCKDIYEMGTHVFCGQCVEEIKDDYLDKTDAFVGFCDQCGCFMVTSTSDVDGFDLYDEDIIKEVSSDCDNSVHCVECYEEKKCESCGDCGYCIIASDEDAYCEAHRQCISCAVSDNNHCEECERCDEDVILCIYCHYCEDCTYELLTHCPECHEDMENEGTWYCNTCEMCSDCANDQEKHCADCGQCLTDSTDNHCPEDNKCYNEIGSCQYDEMDHCYDCCVDTCDEYYCPDCQTTYINDQDEYCEVCGYCNDHAVDELYHCAECGDCSNSDGVEICSTCGRCEEHQEHCLYCETCSNVTDLCSYHGSDRMCLNCCSGATLLNTGCNHSVCMNSPGFANHYFSKDITVTYANKVLTITSNVPGSGVLTMCNQDFENVPWRQYANYAEELVLVGFRKLDEMVFRDFTKLKKVTFPDCLEIIGAEAFYNCSNLTGTLVFSKYITINSNAFEACAGLEGLEAGGWFSASAFENCTNLKTVKIISLSGGYMRQTQIKSYAFKGCTSLENLVVEGDISTIGEQAFANCTSLTSVDLSKPQALTIGSYTFAGCTNLTYVRVGSPYEIKDHAFAAEGEEKTGFTIDFRGDFPKRMGASAFSDVTGTALYTSQNETFTIDNRQWYGGSITWKLNAGRNIEWTLSDDGTLTISGSGEMSDFEGTLSSPWNSRRSEIKKVVVSENVTSLGRAAFYNCGNLTEVSLPSTLTSIGETAFGVCTKLASLQIPKNAVDIGENAFSYSGLTEITLPDGLKKINCLFMNCGKLQTVTIPVSVEEITEASFRWCDKLTTVNYAGTQAAFNKIVIGAYNDPLLNCMVNYGHTHTSKTSVAKAATAKEDGLLETRCSGCGELLKTTAIPAASNVMLSATTFEYDGTVKNPELIIKDSAGKTISSKYYTVTAPAGRTEVGTYAYKITFKGRYTGSKTLKFLINPSKVKTVKTSNTNDGASVRWSESKGAWGYLIYRSDDNGKTFTKIDKTSERTYTDPEAITNGKKYYYKIVAYAKVSKTTYYSEESSAAAAIFVKAPTIKTLTCPAAGKATVTWSSNSKASGYQIIYTRKADFSSYSDPVTIEDKDVTTNTLTSLKSGYTYYVKVRTYIKTSKGTMFYSEWSEAKSVSVK